MIRSIVRGVLAAVLPSQTYLNIYARIATRDIASGKRWEPAIERVREFVKPGDVVLDIGANHGLYAFHLSKMVGTGGRVICFEPIPPNYFILQHTVRELALSNVTTYHCACGIAKQTATFGLPIRRGLPQWAWAHQGAEGQQFRCDMVPLDEIVNERVSFIKCDVEGAELFVFRGARRILSQYRPVILVETADEATSRFAYKSCDLFRELAGYRVEFLHDSNYLLTPA